MTNDLKQRFTIRDRSSVFAFEVIWKEAQSAWFVTVQDSEGNSIRRNVGLKPFRKVLNKQALSWDLYVVPKICDTNGRLSTTTAWNLYDLLYVRRVEFEFLLLPGNENVLTERRYPNP